MAATQNFGTSETDQLLRLLSDQLQLIYDELKAKSQPKAHDPTDTNFLEEKVKHTRKHLRISNPGEE